MTAPDKIKHGPIVKRVSFRIRIAEIFTGWPAESSGTITRDTGESIVEALSRQDCNNRGGYDNDINENER